MAPPPATGQVPRFGRSRESQGTHLQGGGLVLLAVLLVAFSRGPNTDVRVAAAIGAICLALALVGIAWTLVAAARVKVSATSPHDATVGERVELGVEVSGPLTGVLIRVLDPPGSWVRPRSGANTVPHVATRRGVFGGIRIEVWSRGGLGVLSRKRVVDHDLDHLVHVAPRAAPATWQPRPLADDRDLSIQGAGRNLPGEVARSVRPYVPGDPARMVHWPTSLRTGSLVVRELEPPAQLGQAVVVRLLSPSPAAEGAASQAMGLGCAVLRGGGQLVLSTVEHHGPVVALVATERELGRRLAATVPGEPAAPPKGWPVEVFQG